MKKTIMKLLHLFLCFSLLFQSIAPAYIYATEISPTPTEEITPTPEVTSTPTPTPTEATTPTPTPEATPTPTPTEEITPTPEVTSTPTPTPVDLPPIETQSPDTSESAMPNDPTITATPTEAPADTQVKTEEEITDQNLVTFTNVVTNTSYKYKDTKLSLTFTKLPEFSGSLSIKEVILTDEQVRLSGAASNIAYDITSSMENKTFEYDLTLPIPEQSQNSNVSVKFSETELELNSATLVTETKEITGDTITVKGLNHFTLLFVVDPATPSTNDINRTKGWAHVDQVSKGVGTTDLKFISSRGFASCFEYRTDGDTSQKTSNTNFNAEITDGLYPYKCKVNSSSVYTITADEYVEVRMVFGAEKDERFGWTRFEVDPEPIIPDVVYVDDDYTESLSGGHTFGVDAFTKIQEGIDAVAENGMVNIFPGTYHEGNLSRDIYTGESGGPASGLLVYKNGLTLQGVDDFGNPINNRDNVSSTIIATQRDASLGDTIITGDNVTINGLKFELAYLSVGCNKNVFNTGENFTLKNSVVDNKVLGCSALYISDERGGMHVNNFNIQDNQFHYGDLTIINGVGQSGPMSGRMITGNLFEDVTDWGAISLTGITGSSWTTQPIGAFTITGNTFNDNAYQIIARGSDYGNPDNYWTDFLKYNTFDKSVITLTPTGDAQTNTHEILGWVNDLTDDAKESNFRMIGTYIQEAIDRASENDTVLIGKGSYEESPTIDVNNLKVYGAGANVFGTNILGSLSTSGGISGITISDILFRDSGTGAYLVNVSNSTISNNVFSNNFTQNLYLYGNLFSNQIKYNDILPADGGDYLTALLTHPVNLGFNYWGFGTAPDSTLINTSTTPLIDTNLWLVAPKDTGLVSPSGYNYLSNDGKIKITGGSGNTFKLYVGQYSGTPFDANPLNSGLVAISPYYDVVAENGSLNPLSPLNIEIKYSLPAGQSKDNVKGIYYYDTVSYSWLPYSDPAIGDLAVSVSAPHLTKMVVASELNTDTVAPKVIVNSPITGKVKGVVDIFGTVTDENPHHYYLVIQNSANKTIAGPGTVNRLTSFENEKLFSWNSSSFPDGKYKIRLEARDAFENKDSNSVAITEVIVDNLVPSVPVHISPTNGTIRKTSDINKTDWSEVTDASGVVYYYQSSRDYNFGSLLYDSIALLPSEILNPDEPEGAYYWRVRACDGLNNCSAWSTPWAINIDNTSPTVPVNGTPRSKSIPTNNFDFNWDESVDSSPLTYEFQSTLNPSQVGGILTTGLWKSGVLNTNMIHSSGAQDGTWYWQVRAKDSVGNYSSWSEIWNVTIDITAPIITINPYATTITNQDITVTATTNEGSLNTASHVFTSNGSFDFIATDAAGNVTVKTVTISNIDKVKPSTPEVLGYKNPNLSCGAITNIRSITVDWSDSTDDTSVTGYDYSINYPLPGNSGRGDWTTFFTQSQYSGTLNEGLHNIKVRAKDSAGNVSDWSNICGITYDSVRPVITINPYNTNPTNSDVVVSATTNEGTLNENSHTFTQNGSFNFVATDSAGNSSTRNVTITNIDKDSPLVSADNSSSSWKNSIFDITLSVSDTGTSGIKFAKYNWDSVATNTIGTNFANGNEISPSQGTHTLYLYAEDNAGNTKSWSGIYKLDTIAPNIPTLKSPIDGYVTKGIAFTQKWNSVTDAVSYKYESCNVDPGDTNEICSSVKYTETFTGTTKSVGAGQPNSHFWWRVNAKDIAGNWSGWGESRELTIDNTPPVTTISGVDSNWHNTSVTVSLSCTDINSSCDKTYYTTDGTTPTTSSSFGNSFTLGETGQYTIKYFSADKAGNVELVKTLAHTVNIDTVLPTSEITFPENPGDFSTLYLNDWTGNISGSFDDNLSGVNRVELSIENEGKYWNGQDWNSTEEVFVLASMNEGSWNYNLSSLLEDGSYNITSHAIDNATNRENSYHLTVVLDKTIPEVSISINPVTPDASNGWYRTQPEITLKGTDANFDIIQYQWDSKNGEWSTYLNPFMLGQEGSHVLYYRAIDKANNPSEIGIKNISWDKTDLKNGPLNMYVSPNPTSGNTVLVKWEAASDSVGIEKYEVRWSKNGTSTSYTESVGQEIREFTIKDLTEGKWNVNVKALDASGNWKDADQDLIVDRTGPNAPTLTLTGQSAGTASLTWTKVDDAVDYIIWYGNQSGQHLFGARVGNTTSFTVQGLGAGNYYFTIKSVDQAQNQSDYSNEVNTGNIAGAPGVNPGTPAEGFTTDVQGVNTDVTPTPENITITGSVTPQVLGTDNDRNVKDYWWLLLLIIFPIIWKIIFRKRLPN